MSTNVSDTSAHSTERCVPIWDVWVRLFHWSLVIAVLFQVISGRTGWQFFDFHRLIGEVVLALVVFRLLWGLVGSSNARLSALFQSPRQALSHLGDVAARRDVPERGHNAAGSWAVIFLLLLVGIQAVTGLFIADEDEFIEGAFYDSVSSNVSGILYDIHDTNALLMQILVVVHVAMVFVYLLWVKRNLIKPMITGAMRWPTHFALPPLKLAPVWFGLLLALSCGASFAWWLDWF